MSTQMSEVRVAKPMAWEIQPAAPRRLRRRRDAFTLIEVMLVMAILVMIAGIAVVGVLQAQQRATRSAVLTEIKTIENACTQYRLNMGRFPATLMDLIQLPQNTTQAKWGGPYVDKNDFMDPWGNEYQYQADEQNLTVHITSMGPDGQPGTEDDISNREFR